MYSRLESSTNSYTMLPLPQKYTSSQHYPIPSGSPSSQSQSIPIVNQLLKTHSELQLCTDEALAEQKDDMFVSRVLKGINESQGYIHSPNFRLQNQSLVSHIMHTRRQDVKRQPQYEEDFDEDDWTPGLSSIEPYSSRATFLHEVTGSALAFAELDEDDECIFDLEL